MRALLIAVCTLVVLLVATASSVSADPTVPTAYASAEHAAIGQVVQVVGTGWEGDAGGSTTIVVCGNDALDGGPDCALDGTAAGAIEPDGSFRALVTILQPPSPCPCVLRVTAPTVDYDLDLPIAIAGVPSAPPSPKFQVRRTVTIDDVHLRGWGSWSALLVGGARRTLVYRVTNTGSVNLRDPSVQIVIGQGSGPTGYVQAPAIGDLGVRQSKTFRVPVDVPAFSVGTYRAVIKVDPFGPVSVASATTLAFPWAAPVLILMCLGLLTRWAVRRRRRRSVLVPTAMPGWYLDPLGEDELRLWDGSAWTAETSSIESLGDRELLAPHAGWYGDPLGARDQLRLWDGTAWTDQTRERLPVGQPGQGPDV